MTLQLGQQFFFYQHPQYPSISQQSKIVDELSAGYDFSVYWNYDVQNLDFAGIASNTYLQGLQQFPLKPFPRATKIFLS